MNYQRENYSLEIVSRLKDFDGKSLKKYKLEGIETVGVWGNEPFEIKFTNHTHQKIQVKLTLDGTDILTGEKATSEPTGQMWVVNGYGNLVLKAWPESNNGGSQFVFASADKSVAVHTHGDLSHRGIIAAAVFTEGHVEPIRLKSTEHHHHHHHYPNYWDNYRWIGGTTVNPTWGDYTYTSNTGSLGGGTFSSTNASFNLSDAAAPNPDATMDCFFSADAGATASAGAEAKSLQSLASVGAGSYTEQQITYTTGLIKPLLSTTVRVKYVWWDDLVVALRTNAASQPQPSGFPGDKPLMSIGSTPHVNTKEVRKAVVEQLNFARV